MRGLFRTTKYATREDFLRSTPYGVALAENSFTAAGLEWMWQMMLGRLRDDAGGLTDQLESARLVVGDGTTPFASTDTRLAGENTAQADSESPVISVVEDGALGRLALRATFGEQEGNFEWAECGVVTAQGLLLDRAVRDQGRKALGSVWVMEAFLEIASGADS